MAYRYELTKSLEVRKLNPRTGIPMPGPMVCIPYGSVIENIIPDRDDDKFTFNRQGYQCPHDVLKAAIVEVEDDGTVTMDPPPAANGPEPAGPVPAAEPELPASPGPRLLWQRLTSHPSCLRAKVPGGWLVALGSAAVTFYPDPRHEWDGGSLPD